MDPQEIADAALGEEGDDPISPKPSGANPELVALLKRMGRALEGRDWEAAAKAFEDAQKACAENYEGDSG